MDRRGRMNRSYEGLQVRYEVAKIGNLELQERNLTLHLRERLSAGALRHVHDGIDQPFQMKIDH